MLPALAAAIIVLAAQPPATVRSPYLDAVRLYAPGQETQAIAALHALRLRDAGEVFDALDTQLCRAVRAQSCRPRHLIAAGPKAGGTVIATWRRLYPRALALHVEALAASDPIIDAEASRLHRSIVARLVARIDDLAREQRQDLASFAELAVHGRHLLLWALQYLRDVDGLAAMVERYEAADIDDVDLRLARGALEELRSLPGVVAQSARARSLTDAFARDDLLASEGRRQVETAARVYETLLASRADVLEAHLRLARLQIQLGRYDQAESHLGRVARLRPDSRQAYLAALFLADVFERQGRTADAIAAYDVAQHDWPGSQAPAIGLARLRGLSGAHADARAALATLFLERSAGRPERSDPWAGYIGAQSWRLPDGVRTLQRRFEPEP